MKGSIEPGVTPIPDRDDWGTWEVKRSGKESLGQMKE